MSPVAEAGIDLHPADNPRQPAVFADAEHAQDIVRRLW